MAVKKFGTLSPLTSGGMSGVRSGDGGALSSVGRGTVRERGDGRDWRDVCRMEGAEVEAVGMYLKGIIRLWLL